MDKMEAKIECLKLAASIHWEKPQEILALAKEWADFAIDKVKESSGEHRPGADDHRAKQSGAGPRPAT